MFVGLINELEDFMEILKFKNKDVYSWCPNIEDNTKEQIENVCELGDAVKHFAVMPDAHLGYGMPIGGVVGLENTISPYMVGSDIACGMVFVSTDIDISILNEIKTNRHKTLLEEMIFVIENNIPVGFKWHKKPKDWYGFDRAPDLEIINKNLEQAHYYLGSLGSGNHFVELQKDEKSKLCVMIHSGSRKLGKEIGDFYHDKAIEYCNENGIVLPTTKKELAYFSVDSKYGKEYIEAMNFAMEFAYESRQRMMIKAKNIIFNLLKKYSPTTHINVGDEINAHHNYAVLETHFGKEMWVHRKGAIKAGKGDKGIIPGSMGTLSYIVEGLGNELSLNSASHGAGRVLGRIKASKTLTKESVEKSMEGIVFSGFKKYQRRKKLRNLFDYGEAPEAYKNIDDVLENEKDLVKIIKKLKPIGVVKG